MFIGGVQEPIDQAGAALLHDPRGLGLLPILENFVISLVAHDILHLRSAPTVKKLRSIVHSSELTVMYLQLGGWRHGHRSGMRRLRARVRSPRRVDQRPSASGLASHYGPRVDGHREQTKRSRAGIAASVGRPRYLNLPCRLRVIRDQAGRSHSVMRFRFAPPKADAMTHPHPAALVARTGFIPSK